MINFEQLIAVFPQCLQSHPEHFTPEALQDLDILLGNINDATKAELITALKNWMKTHKKERDFLAQSNRELGKVPRNPEINEAGIRTNLFELRDIRKEQKQRPETSKP